MEEQTEVFEGVVRGAKDRQLRSFCGALNRSTTLTHFWQFPKKWRAALQMQPSVTSYIKMEQCYKQARKKGSMLLTRFNTRSSRVHITICMKEKQPEL